MEYTLMHKNIPVMEIEIDDELGVISKIHEIRNPEHIPVGAVLSGGKPTRKWLNDWWSGRAIPASRSGLRDALESLNVSSPIMLLTKCFGLSLSDQYWVNSKAMPVEWKDVNFFENEFSEDVGNALFGKDVGGDINLVSPDNTSDGWLKKRWKIVDGNRVLFKGGSPIIFQEPLNEMIASAIARRLNIFHVPYSVVYEDDGNAPKPLSVCPNFVSVDTGLVPAWSIMQTGKQPGHVSNYQHYISCCEKLGVPGIVHSIDQMIVLDFLICNQDRHFNNFGVLRNAETLEWLGAAPIFDCGTSLWYDTPANMIKPRQESGCKPFHKDHFEQINLVTDFSWLDLNSLQGIGEEFRDILEGSEYIDEHRRVVLCNSLEARVTTLSEIISKRENSRISKDNTVKHLSVFD